MNTLIPTTGCGERIEPQIVEVNKCHHIDKSGIKILNF